MAVHLLQHVQNIPGDPAVIWDFFADPANLSVITPAYMKFHVLHPTPPGTRTFAGQLIDYTLRPVLGIKMYWLTEITHVHDGHYFVDEQRKGPYSLWHHQHHFRPIPGGVEMTDMVHYMVPFGWLGDIANFLFVRRQLNGIFAFRNKKVEEIFGVYPSGSVPAAGSRSPK